MAPRILVGTVDGLWHLGGPGGSSPEALAGRTVTALAHDGGRTWAIVDGKMLSVSHDEQAWETVAPISGARATCLAPAAAGLLIGTEEAHLWRLVGGGLEPLESFEAVENRDAWYTPWGDPADVRSIAAERHGDVNSRIYVNIHVGGVARSDDGGQSWTPTVDIEADVHQVIVHPSQPRLVLVAAAVGLGISRDGGDSWQFVTRGLHAHYLRAVAISQDVVLVTASTGPRGKRAGLYRRPLGGSADFERCRQGLPTRFDDNIDTACLAASGPVVAFGTEDGRVFQSRDAGASWDLLVEDLPAIRCVIIE